MELIDTEKDYVRDLGLIVEVCNILLFSISRWMVWLLAVKLVQSQSFLCTRSRDVRLCQLMWSSAV